ncbi:MAG: tetratricopeptide repeat protein, partial [Myxococcota bacterium]|nr:tetratricopeptide repeat protein [Myxococcota bacterium]
LQLVLEKWPLFGLVAMSCAITISVQTGAIVTFEQFPLLQRIASVPYAYATYIGMTLVPTEPIPIHVHPGREVPVGFGLVIGVVMLAATGWLFARARRAPFALVGWLWFIGMLVPVIGILQVGSQLVADRYTYLPLVGLFVAATWTIADALPGSKVGRGLGIAGAALVLGACAFGSRAQVPYWKDTVTLFARTVEVDPTNHLAHALLARGYEMRGEDEPALEHYAVAAQLRPYHHGSLFAMGQRLAAEGHPELALRAFEAELAAKPDVVAARLELAMLRRRLGDVEGARRELELARGILPESPEIIENLARLDFAVGRLDEAEKRLNEALALDPDFASGYRSLAVLRAQAGRFADALRHAERALSLEPENAESRKLVEQLAAQVTGAGS